VLGRLVDDLLDFSRVEAGKLHIEALPCSPDEIVREVIDGLSAEAERKGLAVKQLGSAGRLVLDPVRLRQVVTNLVGNAVKFTELGHVTVRVTRQDTSLVIDVDDSGPGIPPQGQELLFRPFSRLAPHGVLGAGLGLAISRRLLQAMGGSLALVRSELGRGSTFQVKLPALEPVPTAFPGLARPNPTLKGCRILLAEDDCDLGEVMTELLAMAGAQVSWERDGKGACDRAGEQAFDLLVLDLGLPSRDGMASIRWLRAAGITTPAVAFTADTSAATRRECLEAGFDAHIAKGLDTAALLDVLAERSQRARS
jgi:CheY-like chemotaxis protein